MSKYYNVVSRKLATGDSGKTIYHKVGVLKVTQNGGWFLQMYHQPNTDFMVFPSGDNQLPVINFDGHDA